MSGNLKALISKLTSISRSAAERAASLCVSRGHYEVDVEHLILSLLEDDDSDLCWLCKKYGISKTQLERDLAQELTQFKNGNTRTPVFSPHLPKLLEQAWLLASIESETSRIRSGHLLLALLTEPELSQLAHRASSLYAQFPLEELKHKLTDIAANWPEAGQAVRMVEGEAESGSPAAIQPQGALGKTPALDQFTTNLTQRALDGKIDPVIGRDIEIRQVIDILMRRRQNNPILTGEAGVGKTAVVEGLALRIAKGDVPPPLQGVALHVLDLGLLQAGASVKGEFENRLKNVIDEVKRSPHPIILFIDEAHTMIGAGGQAGQNDAANLLKPALARGELRTIAATTWGEYKKYFEKDAALTRRFQVVKVEEPSLEVACDMLRAMSHLMEKHFTIRIMDEAIVEAVRLSARYITGRQLPDKAVSVLDTACARVALANSAKPEAVELAEKRLERIQVEIASLDREVATGGDHYKRLDELRELQAALQIDIEQRRQRWEQEKQIAGEIAVLRGEIETELQATPAPETATEKGKRRKPVLSPKAEKLEALKKQLAELQGEEPLVPVCVDGNVVAEIISAWTGIPLGKMVKDEIKTVLALGEALKERVIGQDHAIEQVAQRVRTARANLEDPNKPKGVFMFVGPSGVGKTETALALADSLYGGERNLITINMSEYQEAHTVSALKGSPPGYVGYGEGGVLTEAVRRKPYSVVLLDEVEKAHPDVLEMFFQVFDKGVMDDAEGREIDFKNTIIILTSNVGSSTIMQACLNKSAEEIPDADALVEHLRPQLFKAFKPAFLGRMKVVPYFPISDDTLELIIRLKLDRVGRRIASNHKAEFIYDDGLVDTVLNRCTEVDSGARNVDHILNGSVLPEIAEHVLAKLAEGKAVKKVKLSANETGRIKYQIT
ncbi:type VI secretion system ATPase TssH [Chitinivorax sp. B]|uniref:type VI secretion system ATPase TssH n=1 Tax=Chitinivorax sp. B TaxID=2502235 RepID=UPI0010F6E5D7|nr:type VI secretion system ATPase TssH [Chitinivorax sp. B]